MAGGKYNINEAGREQERKAQFWQQYVNDPDFGQIDPVSRGSLDYYQPGKDLETVAREDSAIDSMPSQGRDAQAQSIRYFSNIQNGGKDAVAEADYARRTAQAEQRRRANTEAALQGAEARGMSRGGGSLTAALQSAQGQASDQYGAGLDAAAMAQQRRDSAAGSAASAGAQMNAQDMDRARAKDVWNDWYRQNQSDTNFANWDRRNKAEDMNTELVNKNTWENKGLEQQSFDNKMQALQGRSGAYDSSTDRHMGAANIRAGQKSTLEKAAGVVGDAAKIGASFV